MAKALRLPDLNEQESAFVDSYMESGDPKTAALSAGYASSTAGNASRVLLLRPSIAWAVAVETRKRLVSHAPMALRVLAHLAEFAESEKVQADCAKDLLARAGHVAPRADIDRTSAETPLNEQTTEELRALAARLAGEIAARAKPINANAAPLETQAIESIS